MDGFGSQACNAVSANSPRLLQTIDLLRSFWLEDLDCSWPMGQETTPSSNQELLVLLAFREIQMKRWNHPLESTPHKPFCHVP